MSKEIKIITNCLKRLLLCEANQLQYVNISNKNATIFFLVLTGESPYYIGMFSVSDRNVPNDNYKVIDVQDGNYVYIRKLDLLKASPTKLTNIKRLLV